MKNFRPWNAIDVTPKQARALRQRWGMDSTTVAGRADILLGSYLMFERGQLKDIPAEKRLRIGKALRQLAMERAYECIADVEAAIAADPDGWMFTKAAAKRRKEIRYG